LHLFRKKQVTQCSRCGKLPDHRYKPRREWNVQGTFCSSCHTEMTKEFILKQQEEKVRQEQEPEYCSLCRKEILEEADKNKARWQWNMESGSILCKACSEMKSSQYEKRLNYCSICNSHLGFVRYNPKPKWNLEGQLCRTCWDDQKRIKR
jgi:hypothetical protein